MRVFICWSEARSRQLAEQLSTWLPMVCAKGLSCGISTQPKSGSYPTAGRPGAGFGGPMAGAIRSLM